MERLEVPKEKRRRMETDTEREAIVGHTEYSVCPCCGNRTLDPDDSAYEICPVCFWENDPYQMRNPEETGANKVSLKQARKNYSEFGACEKSFLEYVRKPYPEEMGGPESEKEAPSGRKSRTDSTTAGEDQV